MERKLALIGVLVTAALPVWGQGPTVYRVTTFAGVQRSANGEIAALDLTLKTPLGVAIDRQGNLYIADTDNHRVRRVAPDGKSTVIAGTGTAGFTGNGGPAVNAQISSPRALALDGDKYLYFCETSIQRVRRIDLATGVITHVLGTGQTAFNGDGNPGTSTSFSEGLGLAVDARGDLIIADTNNHRIRRLSAADGRVSTIAGNGTGGFSGDGGPPTAAQMNRPSGVAVHPSGDIYFFDLNNQRIWRVQGSTISTVLGGATASALDGPALQVRGGSSTGMTLDATGANLYFTDEASDTLRRLDLGSMQVTRLAGNGTQSFSGDGGPGPQAGLSNPTGVAVDQQGNVAFAEALTHRVRRVTAAGIISTFAGGKLLYAGDAGPPLQATFNRPTNVKVDPQNRLVIVDQDNCAIRQISTISLTPIVQNMAGFAGACQIPGIINAVTADTQGNVYWVSGTGLWAQNAGTRTPRERVGLGATDLALDAAEQRIYFVAPERHSVSATARDTVAGQGPAPFTPWAGSGQPGDGGDGGPALSAQLFIPRAVALDSAGNLYILQNGLGRIRRISAQGNIISGVVANPGALGLARYLAVDPSGNMFVTSGNQVFRFNPRGEFDAIVGAQEAGYSPDGLAGRAARLNTPIGIAAGRDGSIYVADSGNHVIRRLRPVTAVSIEAVTGVPAGTPAGQFPVRVRVMASDRAPLSGLTVQFSVAPASVQLSAASAVTDADGIAAITAPVSAAGATVTATVTGLTPVNITVTAVGAGGTRPAISAAISLGNFGGARRTAPGGWLELYGSNFAATTREWTAEDFVNNTAPTTLAGTRVTINNQPAFVYLVSPGQINCVAPDGIGTGDVDVVVTAATGSSEVFRVTAAARAPALLAPPSFRRGDRQYVVDIFPDQSYAGPEGLIAGAPFRAAVAGDRVVLYGISFGATNPPIPAGQIAGQAATLANLVVRFGDVSAQVEYAGVAGGFVGLYQFNVVVPQGVSGDVRLIVTVDGVAVAQELWITTSSATPM